MARTGLYVDAKLFRSTVATRPPVGTATHTGVTMFEIWSSVTVSAALMPSSDCSDISAMVTEGHSCAAICCGDCAVPWGCNIKYNKTRPDTRYITPAELDLVMRVARERGGMYLVNVLCLRAAYLTVSRPD